MDGQEIETINLETTIYITELRKDWNKINLVERTFENIKNSDIYKATPNGEIIIQTTLESKNKLNWLADTGSPRSVVDINTAEDNIQKERGIHLEKYNGQTKCKC